MLNVNWEDTLTIWYGIEVQNWNIAGNLRWETSALTDSRTKLYLLFVFVFHSGSHDPSSLAFFISVSPPVLGR